MEDGKAPTEGRGKRGARQGLLLPPWDEVEPKIRAVTSPRDAALLWLLRNGLRCSEAIGLRTSHLFHDNGNAVARVRGKGDKTRDVPLFKATATAVWLAVEQDKWLPEMDRYVLTSQHKPSLSRKAAYNICMEHTGLHPHTLRHMYATGMVNEGVSLPIVKELLGHSSISTTMKYYHVTRGQLIEATNGSGL